LFPFVNSSTHKKKEICYFC